MSESEESVVLGSAQAKSLQWEYRQMSDIVDCEALAIKAALELAHTEPERYEELKGRCEDANNRIRRQLDGFKRALENALQLPTE